MQMLSKHPTGAVIRFRARTEVIGLEFNMPKDEAMGCFSRLGQSGIDVYCDAKNISRRNIFHVSRFHIDWGENKGPDDIVCITNEIPCNNLGFDHYMRAI